MDIEVDELVVFENAVMEVYPDAEVEFVEVHEEEVVGVEVHENEDEAGEDESS